MKEYEEEEEEEEARSLQTGELIDGLGDWICV